MDKQHSCRLTTNKAAAYLGLSPRTLQDWRNDSKGPAYYRIGNRCVYEQSDLDAFLAANRIEPKAAA